MSEELVTAVYSVGFMTLPFQTAGQQISLLKALKVKSYISLTSAPPVQAQ